MFLTFSPQIACHGATVRLHHQCQEHQRRHLEQVFCRRFFPGQAPINQVFAAILEILNFIFPIFVNLRKLEIFGKQLDVYYFVFQIMEMINALPVAR